MKPALLIMAAGLGSRYGGVKQMDAIGPAGETIMDYSIYDAQRAGISEIVFVINRQAEQEFKESVINKYKGRVHIDYVLQELQDIPKGIQINPQRVKPWGTGHAVLMGAKKIKGHFIVINADDFYGYNSFKMLADYLYALPPGKVNEYAMVGFRLDNTLSENGSVSRAICEEDEQHFLKGIIEQVNIAGSRGAVSYIDMNVQTSVDGNALVSLNMWGFGNSVFPKLAEIFDSFLQEHGHKMDKEFFLPSCINEMVASDYARVKILRTDAKWFGLTYKNDKPSAMKKISRLIEDGEYPPDLFQ